MKYFRSLHRSVWLLMFFTLIFLRPCKEHLWGESLIPWFPFLRTAICPEKRDLQHQRDLCHPGLELASGHGGQEGRHLQHRLQEVRGWRAAVRAVQRRRAVPATAERPHQHHRHCGGPAGTHQLHLRDRRRQRRLRPQCPGQAVCCRQHHHQPGWWVSSCSPFPLLTAAVFCVCLCFP